MWYGGGSLRSARWAGEHWMHLLTSSVVKAEGPGPEAADFAAVQLAHIRAFRAAHPDGGGGLCFPGAGRCSYGLGVARAAGPV